MRVWKGICLALLALATPGAGAQSLEKAVVRAEPLQYSTKDGKFRGCGVNIKVLQDGSTPTLDYMTVSVNLWLENPAYALVKSGYKRATMATGTVVPAGLEKSWARIKGQDPLHVQGLTAGEERAILGWVGLEEAMNFIGAVMAGKEELQVSFLPSGTKLERTFYGVPQWDVGATKALQSCFDELANRLGSAKP